jgi:hypothetical protein
VEKTELDRVQNYLRRLFGNPEIRVAARPQREDLAEVHIGGELIGMLSLDDEDGDRSYNFQMGIQEAQFDRAQAYLRKLFGNPNIRVLARPKKKDSAEVLVGDEFIAVLFLEDGERSLSLTMAILDTDLE